MLLRHSQGFGSIDGEHWLGNDFLHKVTTNTNNNNQMELTISGKRFNGEINFAKYIGFNVGDEASKYKLNVGQFVSGYHEPLINDGNTNRQHANDALFSTYDQDNDLLLDNDCGRLFNSGFWFGDCFTLNTNGVYRSDGVSVSYGDGIIWETWTKSWFESLKETKMMLRRKKL